MTHYWIPYDDGLSAISNVHKVLAIVLSIYGFLFLCALGALVLVYRRRVRRAQETQNDAEAQQQLEPANQDEKITEEGSSSN
ncbi:unnamed protein product [[Candida] boidinii]|uniref:Unnamed protein product n=1 Tax=Candida boidinii TaxID=5477 RepID=A0A9W6W857_CANBO|nr:hypothetical protein BVG19_g4187 [[Candida] boidinii]OWB53050.1 hypothetical protein B5S27_g4637 [[Candida] boidinii]OWB68139.1 hypothetical protein B5S30_g3512 [[Candida] boidinii]OWB85224.1 hypothetical protein B5S33_g3884 [[Candida] boidinii]GME67844.1 unnamed protein product [[Candida] boidinii]